MRLLVFLGCLFFASLTLAASAPLHTAPKPLPAPYICTHPVVLRLTTGSLKQNLIRNIRRYPEWSHVVWGLHSDYEWLGTVVIQACTLQAAVAKVLEPYPMTAVFYELNHVVLFEPRRSS